MCIELFWTAHAPTTERITVFGISITLKKLQKYLISERLKISRKTFVNARSPKIKVNKYGVLTKTNGPRYSPWMNRAPMMIAQNLSGRALTISACFDSHLSLTSFHSAPLDSQIDFYSSIRH